MAITKIGQNLWKIKVCVRVPGKAHPANKQETFFGSKTDAEQRKSEIVKELRSGNSSLTTLKTFAELLDLYVLKKGASFSKGQHQKVDLLKRELGTVALFQFPERFEKYLTLIKQSTHVRKGELVFKSPATINRHIKIARAAYNVAVNLEMIDRNPITVTRFPVIEEKPRDRYLTEEEEANLLKVIEEHRPHILPIVKYSLLVPCRKGELIFAKKEQYNPFTNTIFIPESKAGVAIHKPVPESMKEYFKSIPEDCEYLFYRKLGKTQFNERYVAIGDFSYAFNYCLGKAGLKDFRIHDLRHRAVTSLIEVGNNEHNVADIAGWKSTRMLKTYRHINTLKSAQSIRFESSASKVISLQTSDYKSATK